MGDLAQVTVYALYLWLAVSLLWMWRSVLNNRRAHKLADDRGESEGKTTDPLANDEMMSAVSSTSTSASDSNVDLRSDAASTNGSDAATRSLAKANAKLSKPSATTQASSVTRPKSSSREPEPSAKVTGKSPETSSQQGKPHDSSETISTPDTSKVTTTSGDGKPKQPSTIADHLAGIRLPFDLLPMVPNGEKASDQRVSLVSDEALPEIVGAAIADELERLGYSIKTLATDEAVAVRGEQTLGLQIYPEASELTDETGSRFPEAAAGSVAIDLWVK